MQFPKLQKLWCNRCIPDRHSGDPRSFLGCTLSCFFSLHFKCTPYFCVQIEICRCRSILICLLFSAIVLVSVQVLLLLLVIRIVKFKNNNNRVALMGDMVPKEVLDCYMAIQSLSKPKIRCQKCLKIIFNDLAFTKKFHLNININVIQKRNWKKVENQRIGFQYQTLLLSFLASEFHFYFECIPCTFHKLHLIWSKNSQK